MSRKRDRADARAEAFPEEAPAARGGAPPLGRPVARPAQDGGKRAASSDFEDADPEPGARAGADSAADEDVEEEDGDVVAKPPRAPAGSTRQLRSASREVGTSAVRQVSVGGGCIPMRVLRCGARARRPR